MIISRLLMACWYSPLRTWALLMLRRMRSRTSWHVLGIWSRAIRYMRMAMLYLPCRK